MTDVLVVRQAHFPLDPRVRREVQALLDAGYEVDVLCTRGRGEPVRERDGCLQVFRIPLYHRRGGSAGYVLEYAIFLVAATLAAAVLQVRRRYRLIEVHTLPDVLVFAAGIPRLLGARVLLDLHECMPEFYASKFGTRPGHPAVRALKWLEQTAIRFADHALTCTDEMRDVFVGRGATSTGIDVVLNAADETVFGTGRHPPRAPDADFVVICHGAVEERYGLDTAIRAIALLREDVPGLRLEVYGDGSCVESLGRLAAELGVAERVWFSGGYVPLEQLVAAIARADVGLVAMKPDAFRDLTQCNKMYDFVAMHRPVVASRTTSAARLFDESAFAWFEGGNEQDLARAFRAVHDDPAWRDRLVQSAARQGEPYRWAHQRDAYLRAVRTVLAPGGPPAAS
jgi:glycosyltransferase involved in cell wall biosynthesis